MALNNLASTTTSSQKVEIVTVKDGLSTTTFRKSRIAGYKGYAMHLIFAPSKIDSLKEV